MLNTNFLKVFGLIFILAIATACGADDAGTNNNVTNESGTNDSEGESELRVAFSAQPPVLDPQVDTAIITAEIMGHVFEPLVTTDSDYNIVPMLAESYDQSDDGLTITFHLREGVLFHNGEEMVAEDVVASMNRWKD